MPNRIVGIKYIPPLQKIETEERLLQVFADLKEMRSKLSKTFTMYDLDGDKILDFEQFLRIATLPLDGRSSPTLILKGTGDIGGLSVKEAEIEYSLSAINAIAQNWDKYRDGSCNSCRNWHFEEYKGPNLFPDISINERDSSIKHSIAKCTAGEQYGGVRRGPCPKYDAYLRNAKSEPARKLEELIKVAIA